MRFFWSRLIGLKKARLPQRDVGEEFYTKLSSFTGGSTVIIRDSDSCFPTEVKAVAEMDEAKARAALVALLPKIRTALSGADWQLGRLLEWRPNPAAKGNAYIAICQLISLAYVTGHAKYLLAKEGLIHCRAVIDKPSPCNRDEDSGG